MLSRKSESFVRNEITYVHVVQGEYAVSDRIDTVLTTILGSCVSTCIWDPVIRIGGMNHFLLPDGGPGHGKEFRYGLYAMELLINGLLKNGASKDRLEAKLFGGATMNDGLGKIGAANGVFALGFLADEGIRCVAQSLGGTSARRVRFTPTTGLAQQLIVKSDAVAPPRVMLPIKRNDDVIFF
ncbi:MAG: chemotaxis protein CheD [Pseudorhodobacter sp. PARRP1]|nr:MAG: chemotaxis protein CheD [Pseudorhodobacter sp. PARRP1]